MGLYRIQNQSLEPIEVTRFADGDIRERDDLQRMLRESIEIVLPGAMVLAEEFSDWQDSRRRIDLLCLDEDANLVVVELKRGEDGGHMELQSIRYAAMVSSMTFERAVRAHERYLAAIGEEDQDAEERILDYLGWDEPDEKRFAREIRITLVAADFSTEITTTVLWLIDRGLDIRCIRVFPHRLGDETIVSVQQAIPLPSAEEFQVRAREKSLGIRLAQREKGGFTGFWFVNVGEGKGRKKQRSWEESRRYGFIGAGYKSVEQLGELDVGDRIFAYVSGAGYVGAGIVTQASTPWEAFELDSGQLISELELDHEPSMPPHDNELREHCIGVRWLNTVAREDAVKAASRRQTVCRINRSSLVDELLGAFGLTEDDWTE